MTETLVEVQAQRRSLVWTLGLGAFGLAFSLTVVAAYLPPLLGGFTGSTTLIALVLAAEGAFALTLPIVIGPWSDTFHTPLGRRRPFMLVAIGPMAFCLALVAFMPSFWTVALIVFAFFFAYYVYEPPYRGLYPDLLPEDRYGTSQGAQHVLRGVAIGCALVGGGFLYHAWEPFPFLAAALVTVAACGAPILLVREDGGHGRVFRGVHAYVATSWGLFRSDGGVRRFLIANAAFEGTFAAARTFVVLYVIVGLGESIAISSLVLAAVAGGYTVAAVLAGSLASRFGLTDVILVAAAVYGGGYLLGGVPTEWQAWYLAPIFGVAIAGGLVMTLAWGLLYAVMPAQQRGTAAGLATTTKGIGLIVGPLAAGAAIDLFGYRTLWPICGAIVLSSLPLLAALRAADRRSRGEQAEAP